MIIISSLQSLTSMAHLRLHSTRIHAWFTNSGTFKTEWPILTLRPTTATSVIHHVSVEFEFEKVFGGTELIPPPPFLLLEWFLFRNPYSLLLSPWILDVMSYLLLFVNLILNTRFRMCFVSLDCVFEIYPLRLSFPYPILSSSPSFPSRLLLSSFSHCQVLDHV